MVEPHAFLRSLFDTAISSASPAVCMPRWLPEQPQGRVVVIGAGKAAASMACELERQWSGDLTGVVLVPYGHAVQCHSIDVCEAGHPVPDDAGNEATQKLVDAIRHLSASDTVVCLISGGGSSLLCMPAEGLSLAEKQDINSQLLRSGASIHEMNTVRRKLSAVKGGKLAAVAAPAQIVTIAISDVPGNDPALIASGPTVPDTSTVKDALDILNRYQIQISTDAKRVVEQSTAPKIEDPDVRIVATSDDALLAASAMAADLAVTPYSLGDLSGDATEVANEHAALALAIAAGHGPIEAPCVIVSGGETTVNVSGKGRGGRNSEYALALAIALDGHPHIHALAGDTDGIDGNSDYAAFYVGPESLQQARRVDIDPGLLLRENDSFSFFSATGGLIKTGPTCTNVNDFRAILVCRPQSD